MRPHSLVHASLLAAALTFPFASSGFADVAISVDKTAQSMTVAVDGVPRYVWPVSTGRPGFNTPDGRYHALWMSALHHSKEYDNAPMPDSIFFDGGYAIHGFGDTPFGEAAVSHGCVRLPPRDAALLFRLVKREGMDNTTIVIRGRIPPGGVVQEAVNEQWAAPNPYRSPDGAYAPAPAPVYGEAWPPSEPQAPAFYSGGRGYYDDQ